MKLKNLLLMVLAIAVSVLFYQCEKGGHLLTTDDDSDRPAWAGGDTDVNPHIRGNETSGTTRGGDYGDLYKLYRDVDGVPIMTEAIENSGEWFVQPIGADGLPLELNEEGELLNPELATEVEFGRLNLVRAPQNVLDQALDEATGVLCTAANVTLDFCGRLMAWDANGVEIKTIDSPRENLAIYQYLMNNGFTGELACLAEYNFDKFLVSASALAAGSDKTGTILLDELIYINGFMGCVGDIPIENEYEHKWYFNYGDCDGACAENMFRYRRADCYDDRYIQFQVWDEAYYPINADGTCDGPIASIRTYMEDRGMFEYVWRWGDGVCENVEGFTVATDDAVQVLDFIHGDSNIRFMPFFDPNDGTTTYDSGEKVYWPNI